MHSMHATLNRSRDFWGTLVSDDTLAYISAKSELDLVDWSVRSFFEDAVAAVPNRIALIIPETPNAPEQRWTYQELYDQATTIAGCLLTQFQPGTRVATYATGRGEIILLHLGAAFANIVLVTLNHANRADELKYLLQQSRVTAVFASQQFRGDSNVAMLNAMVEEIASLNDVIYFEDWDDWLSKTAHNVTLPEINGHDPVLILFTSGTTGKPKGAVLSHAGIVNNARHTTSRLSLPEGDTWLNVLPMFHVGGSVTMMLGCVANRGTHVLLPEFTVAGALRAIEAYNVGITMAVPTMLIGMLQDEHCFADTDLDSLKLVVTGGTVVSPELVRRVSSALNVELMVMFGQTEAGGAMCLTHRSDSVDRVTQSVGEPLDLSETKIIDVETRTVVSRGEVGEICVRTPCRMIEYFELPEQTSQTIDTDGYVHTGDLGVMRPDGYLQVTGRLKDMIIRGGENIYPREVEDLLCEHPAIAQAAVFGVSSEKWGEEVSAACVLKQGTRATSDELAAYLCERLSRHKIPKTWLFQEGLPVNASGKVMKFVLRENFEQNHGTLP